MTVGRVGPLLGLQHPARDVSSTFCYRVPGLINDIDDFTLLNIATVPTGPYHRFTYLNLDNIFFW